MGTPDVRAFSRSKRGVAGSLVWINFDRHALLNVALFSLCSPGRAGAVAPAADRSRDNPNECVPGYAGCRPILV